VRPRPGQATYNAAMRQLQSCHVLVPAAGSGSRAGTAVPKQYQPLAGQPLVLHTLRALRQVPGIASLNVVVSPDDSRMAAVLAGDATLSEVRIHHVGGATRAASVTAGLQALRASGAHDNDWVLVHDAARCLVLADWVQQLIESCQNDPVGGLLALPLPDTLKQADADTRVQATLTRDDKWLAQTPQMFRLGTLLQALLEAGDSVTDEASAIEAMGLRPRLVRGHTLNLKVTYAPDLHLAQWVLSARQQTPHTTGGTLS
jgi:2-C-methyl-D-erythritol 4-phosphate cytidylyltransferase